MMRLRFLISGCLLSLACHPAPKTVPASANRFAQVDHVILAIDSLDRGIELLARATGVKPVYGGAHPGRGTQNALLSLGVNQYIELIAPNPSDTSATARRFASQLMQYYSKYRDLTPVGWAVHVSDAVAERSRLIAKGLKAGEVRPGSRARPTGELLQWKTLDPFGIENSLLPFVIEWGATTPHPSASAPGGCRLIDLTLGASSPDSITALFSKAGYEVNVRAADSDHMELTFDCPSGRIRFPTT